MSATTLAPVPRILGSPRRTETLILLALLEESYPRELARLTRARLFSIQQILDSLDREGIVSSRFIGKERRVCLNPRFFAAEALRVLLVTLARGYPELERAASSLRRRPRGKGRRL